MQRLFLEATLHRLAAALGVRQFLDIGSGIPAQDNIPAIPQQMAPESRVVYVDNDPLVLAHAHSLQRSMPEGATAYIDADLRDPEAILKQSAATLDFTKPVAIVLVAILHLIEDHDDPYGVVAELVDAVSPGSYLMVSHAAKDIQAHEMARLAEHVRETGDGGLVPRDAREVARFFDGLEMVEPGLVPLERWYQWHQAQQGARAGGSSSPDGPYGWQPPYHVGLGRKP